MEQKDLDNCINDAKSSTIEKVLEIIEKRILSENLVEHPQLNYDDNTQKTMKKVILIHNNALQEIKSEISKLKEVEG